MKKNLIYLVFFWAENADFQHLLRQTEPVGTKYFGSILFGEFLIKNHIIEDTFFFFFRIPPSFNILKIQVSVDIA